MGVLSSYLTIEKAEGHAIHSFYLIMFVSLLLFGCLQVWTTQWPISRIAMCLAQLPTQTMNGRHEKDRPQGMHLYKLASGDDEEELCQQRRCPSQQQVQWEIKGRGWSQKKQVRQSTTSVLMAKCLSNAVRVQELDVFLCSCACLPEHWHRWGGGEPTAPYGTFRMNPIVHALDVQSPVDRQW